MANVLKRDFKVGQDIYVVDYWGANNGTQAFEAYAKILQVNDENKTFLAVLYGDTYHASVLKITVVWFLIQKWMLLKLQINCLRLKQLYIK